MLLQSNGKIFQIAKINFCFFAICLDNYWTPFLLEDQQGQEIDVCIEFLHNQPGRYQLEQTPLQDSDTLCFRYHSEVMLTDSEWRHVRIMPPVNREDALTFILQVFHTHAVQRHMIQVHSSMIDYHGCGLLFLGPSGIGKTTQAELWNKYRGALIINGDMNFVQETETEFIGWGTPWHGSSPYCVNTSVPIRALIVLKQAAENSIRQLEGFEKVHTVSNNIIYPTWLENGMELCLETLDHLLTKIPVYELSCRPDKDAVQLTEATIFGP